MNATLAIYEALIQANVPAAAARRVAETLESDMTSNLATKQDLLLLEQRLDARFAGIDRRFAPLDAQFIAVDARFDAVEARFAAVDARFDAVEGRFAAVDVRFDALEKRFDLKMQNLESRLVVKLGALMVILFGVAGTTLTLLR